MAEFTLSLHHEETATATFRGLLLQRQQRFDTRVLFAGDHERFHSVPFFVFFVLS
jgi:hypothetical protein